MYTFDQRAGDDIELLKWVSERNIHIPVSDLAYMLGIHEEGAFLDERDETEEYLRGMA